MALVFTQPLSEMSIRDIS